MLDVGFGRALITPPLPVALAGFGEPQLATEVHDELEAHAVVLRGATERACLLVCDLLGMSPEYSWPVRAAVAAALSIDEAAVLVASTHTHSGPSAMRGTDALGWSTPEGYLNLLVTRCVEAAVSADAAMRPAEARYGRGDLPDGLSINRRGHPYDPWCATVEFVEPGGAPIGVMANLAVHPVALGPECLAVSADWVSPFRDDLSRRAGAPDVVMLSSALGDVNPRHVHRQDNDCRADGFAEAHELGVELSQALDDVRSTGSSIDADVRVVASRQLELPIGGTPLADARRRTTMTVELVEWALGPIRLVSIPGEAFHALGREVDESRGGRTILAGLAPSWQGYLPVPFVDGGYEEQTSFGRVFVDGVRNALLNVPVLDDSR